MNRLGEVAIIGGGCYGSFYLTQLALARTAAAVTWNRLMVVDRDPACSAVTKLGSITGAELVVADWDDFLDDWMVERSRTEDDYLVPSPFMPHLMARWLHRRVAELFLGRTVETIPAERSVGTPFDRMHPDDGVRYLSHADWTCPVHCIEPRLCPAIRAPRSWEMGDTVSRWTAEHSKLRATAGPVLFTCRHLTHGVGMYRIHGAFKALDELTELAAGPEGADLVVGSVSACHGAMGVLRVGPA